jgi:hypothetical protein
LLTGVLLLLAARVRPTGVAARQLTLFACLDNVLVFCLGALFPMSFTDGGALLKWWRK